MPTIVSLKPTQLENRFDAVYYGPDFLANHNRLVRSGIRTARLRNLVKNGRRAVYFSTDTIGADKAPDSWVPFLTSDDLSDDGCFVNLNAKRRVSPEFAAEYPNGRLRGNELLVKVKGPNQTTAYNAHDPNREILVSGTIWGAIVDLESVDPHYLVAALTCPYGATARTRLRTNTNVEFLAPEDLVGVLLPWPSQRLSQRYIGDKVRQAERLRERARTLEADVAGIHAQYTVQPTGIDFAKRTRRLAARSLTERLDAHFYPSAVEQYFQHFNLATQSLNRLCLLVANGQSQPESAEGERQATVTNLGQSFVDGLMRTVQRPTDGAPTLAPHDLLLCNAAHEKSYIGRDITYSQVDGPFPSTEVMVVRVDRTQIPASFVRHHLKTHIGFLQVQSTIRGITAHSYPSDMKLIEIPIPRVLEAERPAWFATDDMMLQAGRCFDLANVLTSAAKALVEGLIERKVTEAELVTAQEALESGDDTVDRALLRRLTRRGFDLPGQPPLFPDLDALYALLAQAGEEIQ